MGFRRTISQNYGMALPPGESPNRLIILSINKIALKFEPTVKRKLDLFTKNKRFAFEIVHVLHEHPVLYN